MTTTRTLPKDGSPPTTANEIYVSGFVTFCAQLSPSFCLFTLQQLPLLNKSLDVVVSRHKAAAGSLAHSYNVDHIARIVKEVQRCQAESLPVRVHGWLPLEACACRTLEEKCPQTLLHCYNVNDVVVPERTLSLCQEISPTEAPSHVDSPLQTEIPTTTTANTRTTNKRRVNVKNAARAARFVELLVNVVGPAALQASKVGVLDVAGGAGGVAFELSLRRKIPCTVIDPRPVQLNRSQRATLAFRRRARELLQPGVNVSHGARVLSERYRPWEPSQIQCWFDEEWSLSEKGEHMLRDCTAIVGMHPDQATDSIIRLAMKYNTPWMVCPCCVFPKTFQRTLENDRPVKTYEDLCQYILNIDQGVQEATLEFPGRNKVYYWLPKEFRKKGNGAT